MSGRQNMQIMYYYTSFFLAFLCFLSFFGAVNPPKNGCGNSSLALIPVPPSSDDFTREEEGSNIGDGRW